MNTNNKRQWNEIIGKLVIKGTDVVEGGTLTKGNIKNKNYYRKQLSD